MDADLEGSTVYSTTHQQLFVFGRDAEMKGLIYLISLNCVRTTNRVKNQNSALL